MPTNYVSSDTSNFVVKRYLAIIGAYYLQQLPEDIQKKFKNEQLWGNIKEEFNYSCAYCGRKQGENIKVLVKGQPLKKVLILEREYIFMMNQEDVGLHHPGNIIPCCNPCNNSRGRKNWIQHLEDICGEDIDVFEYRKEKILEQIEKYKYSSIKENELLKIRETAKKLYKEISSIIEITANKVIEDLIASSTLEE
ncbi:hypothetical protein F6Y05_21490 [Bacillus megaterium]|nr:hypothetical protein [Priestia megaterium]